MEGSTIRPTAIQSGFRRDATGASRAFRLARPTAADGADIYRLVRDGGTLELNSAYAYLLTGAHFQETSVVARQEESLCGFVWAYRVPSDPATLFVWQIGVAEASRGDGLGYAMLAAALSRPACRDITHLEATVTPSNAASMALFHGFGRKLGARVEISTAFDTSLFPDSQHETEMLLRIGPIKPVTESRNNTQEDPHGRIREI